jgi:hypothetical protein
LRHEEVVDVELLTEAGERRMIFFGGARLELRSATTLIRTDRDWDEVSFGVLFQELNLRMSGKVGEVGCHGCGTNKPGGGGKVIEEIRYVVGWRSDDDVENATGAVKGFLECDVADVGVDTLRKDVRVEEEACVQHASSTAVESRAPVM